MSESELIFVTGASGFLGSHIVDQLLSKGYRVRAAARASKADTLASAYAGYGDRFEVVKITDIANDQFPESLVGVDAIMHTASPLPGRAEPDEMLKAAVDGTLNVIVQGEKAGVRRMVVTSSIVTVENAAGTYTDKDWSPITREMAGQSAMFAYVASKTFAEQALWEWADNHPHVEVTTLNPPYFYGPFTAHLASALSATESTGPDYTALSTDRLLYNLLFPSGAFPATTVYIDVRDVAKAHIRALTSPPTSTVGRKRLVLGAPMGWSFQYTVEFIAEHRPALKERLITATPTAEAFDALPMDLKRIEEVLGMKAADFYTTEQTVLDTLDALLAVEEKWRKAGYEIQPPAHWSSVEQRG